MKFNLFFPYEAHLNPKWEAERRFLQEVREEVLPESSGLNPEHKKIYRENGVDTDNPRLEILAGKEIEVYLNKDIDPTLCGPDGRTNLERMANGEAPYILRNGKLEKVELHHDQQNPDGPLVELSADAHKQNHGTLHPGSNKGEGRGDDPDWGVKKQDHWKKRANDFSS